VELFSKQQNYRIDLEFNYTELARQNKNNKCDKKRLNVEAVNK